MQRPKNFKDLPDKMDAEFVALWLGLTVKAVQRMARLGQLPATKIGSRWMFDKAQIQELFDKNKQINL